MARVRVKHIGKGYEALHMTPAAQRDLAARARRIAAAAGGEREGVVAEPSDPIRKRNRAAVIATRGDSENRILRSLDAGR